MDDKDISDGLKALAFTEPPLGFDPDDVATKAAKRVRNRRASLSVGVASIAVIGAVGVLSPRGTPQEFVTGAAPSSSAPSSPASKGRAAQPKVDLTRQIARNTQHLREVLGTVLPGATDVQVSQFVEAYDTDVMAATVVFRDSAGPATFNLTMAGPLVNAAGQWTRLADECIPAVDPQGKPLQRPVRPDGRPLRCDKIPQSDGSTVVVAESGSVDLKAPDNPRVVERISLLNAAHYRTDGTVVGIFNHMMVAPGLAEQFGFRNPDGSPKLSRSEFPLTENQMIALVTDPAFNLK